MPPAMSPVEGLSPQSSKSENDDKARKNRRRGSSAPPRPERQPPSPRTERHLESVSKMRVSTGLTTEIKVWGAPTVSPSIQPVSSSSSSSESSGRRRSRSRSRSEPPKQLSSPKIKMTSSGRDVMVELADAASGTLSAAAYKISKLKLWAAESTKSHPIRSLSSSFSADESFVDAESFVDSKRSSRGAVAPQRMKETSPRHGFVSFVRDAANETFTGIKELAANLPQTNDATDAEAASDVRVLYQMQEGKPSPERAARALYGAQANYETTAKYERKPSPKKSITSRLSLMQDLVWPFMVCGGMHAVNDDKIITVTPRATSKSKSNTDPWEGWNPIIGVLDQRADSYDESIFTLDTRGEDEMDQIRRLSSWGTMGTIGTAVTQETARTFETGDGTAMEFTMMGQDDDGNKIPAVLLEKAKKRREERKRSKSRTRLVQFDYPPISSVRECPRARPEDLPNLFFTEAELDQIEDDRHNTKVADDVEIVAISSVNSQDDSFSDGRGDDIYGMQTKSSTRINVSQEESSEKSTSSGASFSNYASTPKLRGKQRSASPYPGRRSFGARSNSASPPKSRGFDWGRKSSSFSSSSDASESVKEQRLIKGVQIFLRERSTG